MNFVVPICLGVLCIAIVVGMFIGGFREEKRLSR
jgi:hypothetical protein